MNTVNTPGSIILGAVIIAVAMQFGHAEGPPPDLSIGKSVEATIGRAMVMKLREDVRSTVTTGLNGYRGRKLPAGEVEGIVSKVKRQVRDKLKIYKVIERAVPVWRDTTVADPNHPKARVPNSIEGKTLYLFFGHVLSESLLLETSRALEDRLDRLAASELKVTDEIIALIAEATDDGTSGGVGCWMCIPGLTGEERWYNTCTGEWGDES